jgi:hypothetical protein
LGYVVPSASHRLLGGARLANVREMLGLERIEHETTIGFLLLALTILFFRRRCHLGASKPLQALLFTGAGFLVLSMPAFRVAGHQLFCFPNAVLHLVPFVNHLRVPARFNVMVMMILPIVAMVAVEQTIFPKLEPRTRRLVAALLLLGLVVEYKRVDYFTASIDQVPRAYLELASRPPGTLLELPVGIRDGRQSIGNERTAAMWFQIFHRKKLVGGMIARLPDETFDWFRRSPILSDLFAVQAPGVRALPPLHTKADVTEMIRQVDLRYVLVAPEYRGSPAEAYVIRELAPFIAASETFDGFALFTIARPP